LFHYYVYVWALPGKAICEMTYTVSGDIRPYSLTHSLCVCVTPQLNADVLTLVPRGLAASFHTSGSCNALVLIQRT